jgi:hypothetical protein
VRERDGNLQSALEVKAMANINGTIELLKQVVQDPKSVWRYWMLPNGSRIHALWSML